MFEKPFRRKLVDNDSYFINVLIYIHRNPQEHRCVADFRKWIWSSYRALLATGYTQVQREWVLEIFGGRDAFIEAHQTEVDVADIAALVEW